MVGAEAGVGGGLFSIGFVQRLDRLVGGAVPAIPGEVVEPDLVPVSDAVLVGVFAFCFLSSSTRCGNFFSGPVKLDAP